MSNEKFTPGPWRREGNRVYPITEAGRARHWGGPICSVDYNSFVDQDSADKNEKEAGYDAALIAAAPEMYEFINWIRSVQGQYAIIKGKKFLPQILDKAYELLKKARGEA